MKSIRIDRAKHLCDEPETGHNRWHPDLEPILEVAEGEELLIETRDSSDGYLPAGAMAADMTKFSPRVVHPLTGPVAIKGARPGDLLEVEFLDIIPEARGISLIVPGLGFLHDLFTEHFLVHWALKDGWAIASQIPGVRIPGAPFMGISGVAPSHAQLEAWTRREAALLARGGHVFPPDPDAAVPAAAPISTCGLRTVPPRENGGNFDVKQLTKGAKLFLPVAVEGALFSTGDGHFAQGDGEVCLTAVEMQASCVVRFKLHQGEATRRRIAGPMFARTSYFADPRLAMPERFTATMGMPIDAEGVNHDGDLNLAARNALLAMIRLLEERGFTKEQAYVICSVAVDLRISNVVDVPNFVVCAFLPEAIFDA
ncbi:MAG: acetamidase/formamidase family protein [Alphaproteobacteria bacterium]